MKNPPPAMYLLTLSDKAFQLFITTMTKSGKFAILRPDGKWDVGISFNTLDQLKTAALPKENLSDTVVRLMSPKQVVK